MEPKLTERWNDGKLGLGERILQVGSVYEVFKQKVSVRGEKLLEAS